MHICRNVSLNYCTVTQEIQDGDMKRKEYMFPVPLLLHFKKCGKNWNHTLSQKRILHRALFTRTFRENLHTKSSKLILRKLLKLCRHEVCNQKQLTVIFIIFCKHKSHFHQVQAVSCYCRSLRYNELFSAVRGKHEAAVIKSMAFPSFRTEAFASAVPLFCLSAISCLIKFHGVSLLLFKVLLPFCADQNKTWRNKNQMLLHMSKRMKGDLNLI